MPFMKSFLVHKIQYMCGCKYPAKELWKKTNQELEEILDKEQEEFWKDIK